MAQSEWRLSPSQGNVIEGGIIYLKTALFVDDKEHPVPPDAPINYTYTITTITNDPIKVIHNAEALQPFETSGLLAGTYKARVDVSVVPPEGWPRTAEVPQPENDGGENSPQRTKFSVVAGQVQAAVTLQRTGTFPTDDQALWVAIRNRTSALDFTRYQRFIDELFYCRGVASDGRGVASDVNRLIPATQQVLTYAGLGLNLT